MKKVRIFLSIAAVVFAVAGTMAGKAHSKLSMTGYEFVPSTPTSGAKCIQITNECNPTIGSACVLLNGHKVGDANNVSTECGTQLKYNN